MPHAWDRSLSLKTTSYNVTSPSLLAHNWGLTASSRSFNAGASLTSSGTFGKSSRFKSPSGRTNGAMLGLFSSFDDGRQRSKLKTSTWGVGDRLATAGPRCESSWNTNLEVIPGPQAGYNPIEAIHGSIAQVTRTSKKLEIETTEALLHNLRRRLNVMKKSPKLPGVNISQQKKRISNLREKIHIRKRIASLKEHHASLLKCVRPGTVPTSLRPRFADVEANTRESSKKPGPGQYDFMKNEWQQNMHRAPGIGAGIRLVPAHHHRMLYKEVLLARDDSYDSVGPGQFTPTLAPARTGTVGPAAVCHVQNPRSLEKVSFAMDATRRAGKGDLVCGEDLSTKWWERESLMNSSIPTLSRRNNPYAMYGGGLNTRAAVAKRAPAFQEPLEHVLSGALDDIPFQFGPSVLSPLSRQKQGPRLLPTRLHAKLRKKMEQKNGAERARQKDIAAIEELPIISTDDDDDA